MAQQAVIREGMNKTIGEKIKESRDEKGWSQEELGSRLGVEQQTIAMYESGKRFPRSIYKKLPGVFGKPLSYFLGETEGMGGAPPFAVRILDPYSFREPELRAREVEYQAVPVYEAPVIGGPAEEIQSERAKGICFIPARVLRGKNPAHLGCFEVKGESMMPVVRRGATVCVDLAARPERFDAFPARAPRESIWIVRKDGGLVIKYIRIKDGVIVLVSANPSEDIEVVTNADAIVGRVIYIGQGI